MYETICQYEQVVSVNYAIYLSCLIIEEDGLDKVIAVKMSLSHIDYSFCKRWYIHYKCLGHDKMQLGQLSYFNIDGFSND